MSGQAPAGKPSGADVFGPEEFAAAAGVSRETLDRLKTYAALLADWNARHNLVSRASMADLWRRHFWDSAQVAPLIPTTARTLVDLGSGAGFPGLVLAELRPDLKVTLLESTAKKCGFLHAVADELGLKPEIRHGRIEDAPASALRRGHGPGLRPAADLLAYAQRFWGPSSECLSAQGTKSSSGIDGGR